MFPGEKEKKNPDTTGQLSTSQSQESEGTNQNVDTFEEHPREKHAYSVQVLMSQKTVEEKPMKLKSKGIETANKKQKLGKQKKITPTKQMIQRQTKRLREIGHNMKNQMMSQESLERGYHDLLDELKKEVKSDRFDLRYIKLDETAEGGQGTVFSALNINANTLVAYKLTPIRLEDGINKRVLTGLKILKALDHPNILKYLDSCIVKEHRLYLCVVTEYIGGITLFVMIYHSNVLRHSTSTTPPSLHYVAICRQILEALAYLHSRDIIHMDIKSANIILQRHTGRVKVIDFGLSTWAHVKKTAHVGTHGHIAPEVMKSCSYDCSADIWSLGITMWEMLNGRLPYSVSEDVCDVIDRCGTPQLPDADSFILDVLDKCLRNEPMERAKADELLSLPLFHASDDLKRQADQAITLTVETVTNRVGAIPGVTLGPRRSQQE